MATQTKSSSAKTNYAFAISIVGGLFFIFGFVTWLNSVLIPFLKQVCQLSNFQAYLVTLAFYISYTVMAIPASVILRKTGFTKGMSLGLLIMAIGSLVFIPAAYTRSYPLFLIGLFGQGAGLTLLQTASNPYMTILGPIESAAKRISIMGICNKVAGMIGILILAHLLFSDTQTLSKKIESLTGSELSAELDVLATRLIIPYITMAIILIALSIIIRRAHLPEVNTEEEVTEKGEQMNLQGRESIFNFPYLLFGVFCIFVYVGVEVIAIDTLSLYGQYQGFDLSIASKFAIYSLIALTAGYSIGIILVPKYISQRKVLMICAILGFVFAIFAQVTKGWESIVFVILLSFAHALMWPSIWPLAINKLGRFTKIGSALLIMGIAGGALFPLAYGAIADSSNRQIAYLIILPCYVYILFYAGRGYKIGLR